MIHNTLIKHHSSSKGFSLVEMAVVLVILSLVIGSLLSPLEAQRQQVFIVQTENQLDLIQKALIGFAQANGRLPCPATALADTGVEDPAVVTGTCTSLDGFVPAATLGVRPTDSKGYAIDAWNNRIRYAVTQTNDAGAADVTFTTQNGISNVGITNMTAVPSLRVCATSTGITATKCSGAATEGNYLTNNAVAVIYSTGSTASNGAGDADETANLDADRVFISHDPTSTFDHRLVWLSPYVLYDAMFKAGQIH